MRCVKLYTVCTITHCVYNYMLCVQLHTEVLFAFKKEKLPSLFTSAADRACDFYEVRYLLLIFISIRNFFWNTLYVTWEERTGYNSSTSWLKCWNVYCLRPIWYSCCMIYTNINIICILLSPHWHIIIMKLRFSLELPLNLPHQHQEQRKSGVPDWWQSTRRWRSQHLTRWSPTSPPADNHSPVVGRLFDFVPWNKIFEDSIVKMLDLF